MSADKMIIIDLVVTGDTLTLDMDGVRVSGHLQQVFNELLQSLLISGELDEQGMTDALLCTLGVEPCRFDEYILTPNARVFIEAVEAQVLKTIN